MTYKHRKTIYFPLVIMVILINIASILLINNEFALAIVIGLTAALAFYLFYIQKQGYLNINAEYIEFQVYLKRMRIDWKCMRLVTVESYYYPQKLIPKAADYMKFKFIYNNGKISEDGISASIFTQADCVAIEQELYQYCRQYKIKMRKQLLKYSGRNQFSLQHDEFLVGRDD
ncbi:MAG TPA: hypothetical protein DEF47_18425 [Herpetosiphon sp.]|nr:hypothetical protein [Herpetosiphon sp.]HBW51869.1 hypothetical protein [Herpetosiphon sp.]